MLKDIRDTATRLMVANGTATDGDHAEAIVTAGGPLADQFYRMAVSILAHPEDIARDELAAHAEQSRRERRGQLPPADVGELLDRMTPDEMRRAAEGFLWNACTIGRVLEDRDNVDTLTEIEEDLRTFAPSWLPATSEGQDPVAGRWWADVLGVDPDRSVVEFEQYEDERGGPDDE